MTDQFVIDIKLKFDLRPPIFTRAYIIIPDLYDINAVMLMFFNHLKAYHEYKWMNDSKNDSILNSDQIIALW